MPVKFFYHDVDAAIDKMVTMLNAREPVVFGVELEGGYFGDECFVCGFVELLAATVQELTQTPTGLTCLQYVFTRSTRMPKALVKRSAELLRQYGPPKQVPQGLGWLRDNVTRPPVTYCRCASMIGMWQRSI
jgi:hypothetical protein